MSKCILTVGSVTQAMKSKNILEKNSIAANIIKSSNDKQSGCTHAIEFGCENSSNVIKILSASGIKFKESER